MKLRNLLISSLFVSLAALSNAQAATSINKSGTLLVTLANTDNLTTLFTRPNSDSFLFDNQPIVCDDGTFTSVETFEFDGQNELSVTRQGFCDVTHVRVAGLMGNNVLSVGGTIFGTAFDFSIPGTLDIRGGGQNDTVFFGNNVSVGKLLMTLRGGNNRVRGAANDATVSINGVPFNVTVNTGSISVSTTLDIDTNNGDDRVNFRSLTVGGTADINVGGGDDIANIFGGGDTNSFNKVFLRLGNGDNEGSIRNTICHLCQVFGGGGKDDIFLGRVTAGIDVDAIAGGGDDYVELRNVTSGTDVNANGGAGNDCLIDDGSATTVSNFEACEDE